jgi:ClpP class serine protease
MANVIREFAKDVTFIVPYYAKSAATLLCLSGNKILMGPISELGPTNPMMSVDERLITPTLPDFARIATEPLEKESRQRQMAAHALRDFLIAAGVLRSDGKGYDPRSFVRIHGEWSTQSFFAGGF